MMYVHFCRNCSRFHLLNGHKLSCPACSNSLTEMRMPYMDYINMTSVERDELIEQCHNEDALKKLGTTYRMYKYSKWYRAQLVSEA